MIFYEMKQGCLKTYLLQLTLLLPVGFWVNISLQAAGFNIMKLTSFTPKRCGVVEEMYPYKYLDISTFTFEEKTRQNNRWA